MLISIIFLNSFYFDRFMTEDKIIKITKMFGIEQEFFITNNEGSLVNEADELLKTIKNKLIYFDLKQECGHSMLELTTFPHINTKHVFDKFFIDFESFLYEIEKKELALFYYGTFPGLNETRIRDDKRYFVKSQILGEEEFKNSVKCIGFHFHYSLPKNSFNEKINYFYPDIKPNVKNKVLNLFNLYIAIDPSISTLMQSSPYLDGKYLGKDARIIAYRGDSIFNYKNSLYSRYPEFGTLNEYSESYENLLSKINERKEKWKSLLNYHNMSFSDFAKKDDPSLLDSSWKPVKISPHGTIECRGADMNSIGKVVALSSILKSVSKFVEDNNLTIIPSDIGNNEFFKLEDDILYVPKYNKLIQIQKESAIYGMENRVVFEYTSSFFKFTKSLLKGNSELLNNFEKIIETKQTTSDDIIKYVKSKQGYTDIIENETAKDISIKSYNKMYKELILTKKIIENNHF